MQIESERNPVKMLAPLIYPALVVLNLEHLHMGRLHPEQKYVQDREREEALRDSDALMNH